MERFIKPMSHALIKSSRWFRDIRKQYGSIEVLVNNAGITRDSLMMRMPKADWEQVVKTNLTAVYHCCKAVSRTMAANGKGVIVSIGSGSGDLTPRRTNQLQFDEVRVVGVYTFACERAGTERCSLPDRCTGVYQNRDGRRHSCQRDRRIASHDSPWGVGAIQRKSRVLSRLFPLQPLGRSRVSLWSSTADEPEWNKTSESSGKRVAPQKNNASINKEPGKRRVLYRAGRCGSGIVLATSRRHGAPGWHRRVLPVATTASRVQTPSGQRILNPGFSPEHSLLSSSSRHRGVGTGVRNHDEHGRTRPRRRRRQAVG